MIRITFEDIKNCTGTTWMVHEVAYMIVHNTYTKYIGEFRNVHRCGDDIYADEYVINVSELFPF